MPKFASRRVEVNSRAATKWRALWLSVDVSGKQAFREDEGSSAMVECRGSGRVYLSVYNKQY